MAIVKRGKISSSLVVSSFVFVCHSCGYTKISDGQTVEESKCKKCGKGKMMMVSGKKAEKIIGSEKNRK